MVSAPLPSARRDTDSKARLRLWADGEGLVADVHDAGRHWRPDTAPGQTPPGENATSGMGLWVARLLSRDIVVRTGAEDPVRRAVVDDSVAYCNVMCVMIDAAETASSNVEPFEDVVIRQTEFDGVGPT